MQITNTLYIKFKQRTVFGFLLSLSIYFHEFVFSGVLIKKIYQILKTGSDYISNDLEVHKKYSTMHIICVSSLTYYFKIRQFTNLLHTVKTVQNREKKFTLSTISNLMS